jgi:hypothetical protein
MLRTIIIVIMTWPLRQGVSLLLLIDPQIRIFWVWSEFVAHHEVKDQRRSF